MPEALQITPEMANPWEGYKGFKFTDFRAFLWKVPFKTIMITSGNQGGKTATVAHHYVDRVLGRHPIAEKNKLAKKIRCMSSSLPECDSAEEQDNTQYLELRKMIPPGMIKKDITARNKNLVVHRPPGQSSKETVFEFRSVKQELQDLGKIQLSSVWHDEETPKSHREECKVRLLAEGGDEIFTLTPTNSLTYTYDDVWLRAQFIMRTDCIVEKFGLPKFEYPNKGTGIGCFQMATDDNPTLDPDEIERLFEDIPPDEIPLRRYGVFKAQSGRVVKTYDQLICYIPFEKYFPDDVPYKWVHARGIDYHESRIPWSVGWLSASPEDEWFLWNEFHPAIDGTNAYNTYEIAQSIARKSGDFYYDVNIIDPLANKKQANTLFSTTEDLNRYFEQIRSETGVGTPTFWQGWDTKGKDGRDEISKRFKNAVRCGRPFNNLVKEKHGRRRRLPTLWITSRCPKFHKSIMNWRFGEYVTSQTKAVNDLKSTPQQKMSHDNMVLEAFAKDPRLLHAASMISNPPRQAPRKPNKSIRRTGR